MLIKKVEVKTFKYDAKCNCGGFFRPDGLMLASNPPQYRHYCNLCDSVTTFSVIYPYLASEEILT